MSVEMLSDIVGNELAMMDATVDAIRSVKNPEADHHAVAAIAFYLHALYGGFENVLKRFLKFHGLSEPIGIAWHSELLTMFENPARPPLPTLISDQIKPYVRALRGFRHVVRSNYMVNLEWAKIQPNVEAIDLWIGPWQAAVLEAIRERRET